MFLTVGTKCNNSLKHNKKDCTAHWWRSLVRLGGLSGGRLVIVFFEKNRTLAIRGGPMTFSRGDLRLWWFSGSIKPFWGLARRTWSHFLRERRS